MDPIARRFSPYFMLSDEERAMLGRLHSAPREIEPRTLLVSAGDELNHSFMLQDGWAKVFKDMPDGSQQIVSFAVPYDFLGLFSIMLGKAEHSIETITRATACELRWEQMLELFNHHPRLAMAICWFGARDQVLLREHMARIGRQSAFNRIGHIILELYFRLDKIGLVQGQRFDFPVTQEMLADALGLTPIHVSRTLKKLRQTGLIDISNNHIELYDSQGLGRMTDFDDAYLHQSSFPKDIADQADASS